MYTIIRKDFPQGRDPILVEHATCETLNECIPIVAELREAGYRKYTGQEDMVKVLDSSGLDVIAALGAPDNG